MEIIKKNILLLFVSMAILLPAVAQADFISPGFKGVDYCFKISNINEYSDYIFISSHEGYGSGGFETIEEGECISPYFPETILAIKRVDFEKIGLGTKEHIDKFNKLPYVPNPEDEKQRKILEEKTKILFSSKNLLNSGVELESIRQFPVFSKIEYITDVLKIKSINDTNFNIVKSEVVYTFVNGKVNVVEYKNQGIMPQPKETIFSYLFNFLITFAVEFLIILAFIKSNPKKILLYSFIINLITFPIANVIYHLVGGLIIVEVGVFIVEFILLKKLLKIDYKKAAKISFVANIITAIMGIIF